MQTQTSPSAIFSRYNHLRTSGVDAARLDRALGIAQLSEPRPYSTTTETCSCPDHRFRHTTCKHMLAARLVAA